MDPRLAILFRRLAEIRNRVESSSLDQLDWRDEVLALLDNLGDLAQIVEHPKAAFIHTPIGRDDLR